MNSTTTFICRAALYASALCASGFAGAESSIPVEPVTDPADYDVEVVDESRPWAFTMYTVWLSEEQLGDVMLFQGKLEDSQLYVAALSRKIGSLNAHIDAEIEGQVAKHAGPLQRHWEVNGLGTLRWKTFPWDKYLDTTAATGLGLSYAFDDPLFEIEAHDRSNKWLVYIMVELTFSLPEIPQWALVARVHHRSAAYGTFEDDLEGASNSAGFGLKYRF